jgi:hypothetical protein
MVIDFYDFTGKKIHTKLYIDPKMICTGNKELKSMVKTQVSEFAGVCGGLVLLTRCRWEGDLRGRSTRGSRAS